ncbi:MAG: glutamate-5-semialdehyde dehydrogenase [Ruminococcaceae bacterium]|nr:glutamate-5-semialdehyde dehydrogenase [Oscillospiraceae bacterium]
MTIVEMGKRAKEASRVLATAGASLKTKALYALADALEENCDYILAENEKDLEAGRAAGMSKSLLDRLSLSSDRVSSMAQGARQVASFQDPVGAVLSGNVMPNGLQVTKVRVPLGVIGIIYEARPNVTADAAALCLKAGNAVILRGGKEAINSNMAVAKVMREAVKNAGLPIDSIQLIEDTTRQSSIELMGLTDYLDVLIPRGGAGLIKATVENAKVPVIETGTGNCHVYVDEFADLEMAKNIVFNGKTSRPSVCNAVESVLVHKSIAEEFLPLMKAELDKMNVELRGCSETCRILGESVVPATDDDYFTEFLDYILSVKVVSDIDEAIAHIAKHSTGHSECIVTENYSCAEKFIAQVDAAAVYVNASTRFTDGGEFGLGAEIGISTQKLHARGPMGINELTSMKFIVKGSGQIR